MPFSIPVGPLLDSGPVVVFLMSLLDADTGAAWAALWTVAGADDAPLLLAAALLAPVLAEGLLYEIGRKRAAQDVEIPERLRRALLERPKTALLGLKFLFPLRWTAPLAAGACGIGRDTFWSINTAGQCLRTLLFAACAYGVFDALYALPEETALVRNLLAGLALTTLLAIVVGRVVLERLATHLKREER